MKSGVTAAGGCAIFTIYAHDASVSLFPNLLTGYYMLP